MRCHPREVTLRRGSGKKMLGNGGPAPLGAEADAAGPGELWCHEPTDGFKQRLDVLIVRFHTALQLRQLLVELFMRRQDRPKPYERPDDIHTHLHGATAVKHVGRHDRAMLGESPRTINRATVAAGTGRKLRPVQIILLGINRLLTWARNL